MKKDNNFDYKTRRKVGTLDTEFNNNNNKVIANLAGVNTLRLNSITVEQFSRKRRRAIGDILSKRFL